MRSPQAVIDAAVPELPKLRRALIAAREDLILGFGAAPLAAAAGSFATTAGADFSPGRGADLLLLVQRVQRKRVSLCRRSWATRSSTHTRSRAPRMRTHALMIARLGRECLARGSPPRSEGAAEPLLCPTCPVSPRPEDGAKVWLSPSRLEIGRAICSRSPSSLAACFTPQELPRANGAS